MQKIYYLKFKHTKLSGSPEHFFHLMWGYLLPALYEIIRLNSKIQVPNAEKKFIFMSCGPIMNETLKEILFLFNYNYEIVDKKIITEKDYFSKIIVPRWDIWIRDIAILETDRMRPTYLKPGLNNLLRINPILLLNRSKFKAEFLTKILEIRSLIIDKINDSSSEITTNSIADKYLILKRSPQPKYYNAGGGAEIPTYGTKRRELTGIEDTTEILLSKNIPVQIYEPGKHTLSEQIIVFQNCKGVIGIKGAEFANLMWMKPNSKVIIIWPTNMKSHPFQEALSKILGLKYHEIITNEGSFPKLNADSVLNFLTE